MGRRRRRASSDTARVILPGWLQAWIGILPRTQVEVAKRIQDWQDRQKMSVGEYLGYPGLEDARWDSEYRHIMPEPAPDGTQGIIVDPLLLDTCRSHRSEDCLKATTGRVFITYRGRVVGAVAVCAPCLTHHRNSDFQWRPNPPKDGETRPRPTASGQAGRRVTPGVRAAEAWLDKNPGDWAV